MVWYVIYYMVCSGIYITWCGLLYILHGVVCYILHGVVLYRVLSIPQRQHLIMPLESLICLLRTFQREE